MSASDMQPAGGSSGRFGSMRSRSWRPFSKRATVSIDPAESAAGDLLLDERTLARLRRLSLVAGRALIAGLLVALHPGLHGAFHEGAPAAVFRIALHLFAKA